MDMTYSESAKGVTITRKRAIVELKRHGVPASEWPDFYRELGYARTYTASAVLAWLGY